MDAPRAIITIADTSHTVIFDFNRLVAIEAATGRTALQTLSEFAGYAPDVPDGQEPTAEQAQAAAERFSVTSVGRFVAGCLGIPVAEVGRRVPMGQIREVFAALIPGFVEAVKQLSGGGTTAESAADPSAAPQTSAA